MKLKAKLVLTLLSEVAWAAGEDIYCPAYHFNATIMKKIIINSLVLLLCIGGCYTAVDAQTMPRTVVGSAGGYYQNVVTGSLHWTVGEVAVSRFVEEFELAEGFHQMYFDLLVDTEDIPSDWEVQVYPNPTANWITIDFPLTDLITVRLYANNGQLLYQNDSFFSGTKVDMTAFPEGAYILQMVDENQQAHTAQVLKFRP